jgi:hypothetical protein
VVLYLVAAMQKKRSVSLYGTGVKVGKNGKVKYRKRVVPQILTALALHKNMQ